MENISKKVVLSVEGNHISRYINNQYTIMNYNINRKCLFWLDINSLSLGDLKNSLDKIP